MALTPGNTVASSTTLSAFLDLVYANRTNLPAGSATFTAIDPVKVAVSWSGVGNGDNMVYIYCSARQMIPGATIAV